jgi:hypothetical protein
MKLRETLRKISAELGRKNGHYSHDDVIFELRKARPDLIQTSSKLFENIALKRILNDIESKQSKSFNLAQLDMFPELGGLPLSIPGGSELPKGSRLFFQKLTIRQIRDYLKRDQRQPRKPKKNSNLEDFLNRAEAENCIVSDEASLEEVILNWREKK